jgi:hypothetical protein
VHSATTARRSARRSAFDDPYRPGELFDNELLSGLVSGSLALSRDAELAFVIGYYDQITPGQAGPSVNQRMLAARRTRVACSAVKCASAPLQRDAGRWSVRITSRRAGQRSRSAQAALQAPANQSHRDEFGCRQRFWSVFGEAACRPDQLTLRLAARYTDASRDFDADRTSINCPRIPTAPGLTRGVCSAARSRRARTSRPGSLTQRRQADAGRDG